MLPGYRQRWNSECVGGNTCRGDSEKCLPSHLVGKHKVSKVVEAPEADGECMLLASGVGYHKDSNPDEVMAGSECKFQPEGKSL